jgi:endoglucanase
VPSLELAFEGELELGVAGDLASGEDVFQAEFSPLQEPGRYRLEVPELGWSHPFAIESRVYENLFRSTGGRLYQQRNADLEAPFESPPEHPQLVRGGWFELGEATTSLESASTLWGAFSLALDLVGPGHFEDGVPDLLDELEWGMRWARSMQTGDGSVSPQVSHGRTGSLQVHAPTLAATARFAAMGAIHGRLLADHRPARARQALEAARQAWEFLEKHPPQESAEDSRALRLWAAAELYRTSGEPRFQDAYGRLSSTFQPDLTAAPESTLPFWAMALSRHADKDIKLDGQAREICLRAARLHLKWMNQSAYGIPRPRHPTASGGFSPATTGIAALVLLQGYHLGGGPEMLDACWRTPGFQLGSNPLGKCFVTGVGAGSVPHPGTPVPGPIWHLSGSQEPMASVNAAYYPPERPLVEEVEEGAYPALRRYLDDPRVSPMNQGTLRELGYVVAAYGVLSEGPAGLRPLGAWQP